jgi:ElaB/YqjD/DUF883 family membrane-anchored ribosome-binding protein
LANKEKDLRSAADRSLRETRRDFDRRIDEIRADLNEKGPEAVEKVERSLEGLRQDLKEELQDGYGEIHDRLGDEVEYRRREVREHPLLAVGVAVTFGVLVGMIVRKSKN